MICECPACTRRQRASHRRVVAVGWVACLIFAAILFT